MKGLFYHKKWRRVHGVESDNVSEGLSLVPLLPNILERQNPSPDLLVSVYVARTRVHLRESALRLLRVVAYQQILQTGQPKGRTLLGLEVLGDGIDSCPSLCRFLHRIAAQGPKRGPNNSCESQREHNQAEGS